MLKDFFAIDGRQQYELMVGLIQSYADNSASSLEALSEKQGKSPDAVWGELCVACGIEPCGVPKFLMPSRD